MAVDSTSRAHLSDLSDAVTAWHDPHAEVRRYILARVQRFFQPSRLLLFHSSADASLPFLRRTWRTGAWPRPTAWWRSWHSYSWRAYTAESPSTGAFHFSANPRQARWVPFFKFQRDRRKETHELRAHESALLRNSPSHPQPPSLPYTHTLRYPDGPRRRFSTC
jgi:hypothetical protein